ncbi:hypothetical protein P280DRAFT_472270 [Massarina eburnea CBS 473.64]|uniref:Uncharacterized protein n=1 Tax=Massarina eburnea CBS 473.64 TaxID=1395130 RepID=A0A6A6RR37_9PLEO|nr:hypothetical protein P280DRAFT_472270 [Massarina eburnea CBS 473.64]
MPTVFGPVLATVQILQILQTIHTLHTFMTYRENPAGPVELWSVTHVSPFLTEVRTLHVSVSTTALGAPLSLLLAPFHTTRVEHERVAPSPCRP